MRALASGAVPSACTNCDHPSSVGVPVSFLVECEVVVHSPARKPAVLSHGEPDTYVSRHTGHFLMVSMIGGCLGTRCRLRFESKSRSGLMMLRGARSLISAAR